MKAKQGVVEAQVEGATTSGFEGLGVIGSIASEGRYIPGIDNVCESK